ncbi:MAG TPA: DUF721 domain-containing protein [bacterium]|nr:DUF721 domain-containing protein [bacterium]HQG45468.1 DUF721 domain-containing protein [bacterium]HQI47556.1 DUF721 domain-containing protein [bacterium]HQJ63332.1 DUF721 domain-containing protein [bacterium]
MAKDNTRHISQDLAQLVQKLGLGERLRQQRVITEWPRLVGERVAAISHAERLQDGVLFVRVASATWRTELLFQKALILEKIRSTLGENLVREIRFI